MYYPNNSYHSLRGSPRNNRRFNLSGMINLYAPNILKVRNVKSDKTRGRNCHIHWDPTNYTT